MHSDLEEQTYKSLDTKQDIIRQILRWAVLIVSLVGGAFSGIFYFYIQIDCQLLKSSWRLFALSLAMSPFVYFEYKKGKDSYLYSKETLLSSKLWKTMFLASLGNSLWTASILVTVNYISIAQSFTFTNLHSIMIVLYNLFKKIPVSRLEVLGSLFATIGTVFLAFDTNVTSKEGMVDLTQVTFMERLIYGDLMGLIGSAGAAFYFTKNHELKYDFPLYLGIMIMSFFGFLQISFASIVLEGATLSFNAKNGLFGLFSQEWFVTYIYIVIITGYGAYVAYVLALKYFKALLVSVVLTLEPIAGALIVYMMGWQSFPGALTLLGFMVILPGIIVISIGKDQRPSYETKGDGGDKTPLLMLGTNSS